MRTGPGWTIDAAALCLTAAVLIPAVGSVEASPQDGEQGIPHPLARLEFMLGSWTAPEVEFLDEEGQVVRTSAAEAVNESALDGRVILHAGRLADPEIATRAWHFWDDGTLKMGSVSSRGFYDEFVGGWEGDRLVMTTDSRADDDDGPLFRMIHEEIGPDSFVESMNVSNDGGRTWRRTSRQTFRRVGSSNSPQRSAVLDAIDAYTGQWRSEDKTTQEGETFHFEYELEWIDPGRTIVEMLITRVGPDGTSTVFEGYKGLDPSGSVYYFAVSPSGRGARGRVRLEESDLVTLYEGWTAEGDVVEIRDVFEPVDEAGDSFVSRSFLRRAPGAEWQQLGEDHWRRIDP